MKRNDCSPGSDIKKIFLLLLFTGFVYLASAQPASTANDPQYIRDKGAEHFNAFQYDSALYYFKKLLQISEKENNPRGNAIAKAELGNTYFVKKEYKTAIRFLEEAIQGWKKQGNDTGVVRAQVTLASTYTAIGEYTSAQPLLENAIRFFKKTNEEVSLMISYHNLANNFIYQGNTPKALENYLVAAKMAERLGNKQLAAYIYNGLGLLYIKDNETEKALANIEKSLQLSKEINDKPGLGGAYINQATAFKIQGRLGEAEKTVQNAIAIYKELGDKQGLGRAYITIGRIYEAKHNYQEALNAYKDAVTTIEELGEKRILAGTYSYIGNMYNQLRQPEQAKIWLNKGLVIANEINSSELRMDTYNAIAESDSLLGNYEQSLRNYKQYIINKDELFNKENVKKITTLEVQSLYEKKQDSVRFTNQQQQLALQKEIQLNNLRHEYEQKQALAKSATERQQLQQEEALKRQTIETNYQLARLKEEQAQAQLVAKQQKQEAANKIKFQQQKNLRNILIAGLLLIAGIGGLLYYQNRSRRKINTTLLTLNNELDEANKVKARFFAILSHDLRSPVASLVNYLQLQEETVLNAADANELRTEIKRSASGLLENMETLLTWSKSQMENFKPTFRQVPVDSLFEYLKSFFENEKHTRFSFENDDVPFVNSDPNYLQTIMYNLTANAVKALQQTDNAMIEWKAWKKNEQVYLSITDNGPGISTEASGILFRNETAANKKTGFGLHIIRDLAKAIQCTVSIDDHKSSGTRFILRL